MAGKGQGWGAYGGTEPWSATPRMLNTTVDWLVVLGLQIIEILYLKDSMGFHYKYFKGFFAFKSKCYNTLQPMSLNQDSLLLFKLCYTSFIIPRL